MRLVGVTNEHTFADLGGVTHEAMSAYHPVGTVSLCGRLRHPIQVKDKTLDRLRVRALRSSPGGVDCMSCLVARTRLEAMIEREAPSSQDPHTIELDIGVASWV